MEKEILKNLLLSLNFVYDNIYLEKYISLIIMNKDRKFEKYRTQKHHIIPRYTGYIDNSTVNLLYKDHILCHYYLALCSSESRYVSANCLSIRYLLNGESLKNLDIENIDLDIYQNLYEESKFNQIKKSHTIDANKKISKTLRGRQSPNKGNKKLNRKQVKISNKILKNKKLSEYAKTRVGEKNPFYGKKHSNETKEKISKKNGKAVRMIDIDSNEVLNEFNSATAAVKYLYENNYTDGLGSPHRILDTCKMNNKNYKAYGFNWEFINKV